MSDRTAGSPRRVFLGAFGQPGHAFPMLALGRRLARRGHRVTFETWSRWRQEVEAAGMSFVAAPEYPVFPTRERPLKPYEAVVRATGETRLAVRKCAPDIVVHDILTLAPALAGELEGVPVATLIPHLHPVSAPGFPPYATGAQLPRTPLGRAMWRAVERPIEAGLRQGRSELNGTRQRLGLLPRASLHGGLSEQLCLVATFPGLEYPRQWPAHVHVVGPMLWEPPAPELTVPSGRGPLVLIAPSTAQDPGQRMLSAAIRGLAGGELRVLASANRRPLSAPARLGPGITLVNWLSYAQTMPRCDLVVLHAGHGTLVRSLACGVPVLAVPHTGDMGENAARVAWSGAGLRLPWRFVTPRALRLAVERALDERDRLAARAAEFASWSAAHDGPTRAAELIEELVARRSR